MADMTPHTMLGAPPMAASIDFAPQGTTSTSNSTSRSC